MFLPDGGGMGGSRPMSKSKQENLKNVSFQCFISLVLLPLMLIDSGTSNASCYGLVTNSSLFEFYPRKSCFKWKTRGVGFEVIQGGETAAVLRPVIAMAST
jgi:hypothetical protein